MSARKYSLILVDGSSYLYRAFHAMPALMNSKGRATGAIYGMINMLKKLINDYQPDHMAVVFDPKGKTFRDDMYTEYKATREEMPNELSGQIEPIHQIIKNMGISLIIMPGFEADDVIGSLVANANEKMNTLISTGDKDLAQLVTPYVTLINTMNNTLLDEQGVFNKFGVRVDQIIDYLTLVGDTSDNIPGVAKVGPKTAAKWLNEYGTLDNIINNANKISGKVGENLRDFIPQIPLTRQLVTIKKNISLPFSFANLKIKTANNEELINIYKELEFKAWLNELMTHSLMNEDDQVKNYEIIDTKEKFRQLLNKIKKNKKFAFHTIIESIDENKVEVIGFSFALIKSQAAYLPLNQINLPNEEILLSLKEILEDNNIKKIGHDIKNDIKSLLEYSIILQGTTHDVMLESYVLDSISNNHDIDSLALKYLGWKSITLEELVGKGAKQIPLINIKMEKIIDYAAERADLIIRLHEKLYPKIETEPGLKNIFIKIEMPLLSVLADMEFIGVLIDPTKLQSEGIDFKKRLQTLEETTYVMAGSNFNINSPKQLQEILFTRLKLPILQKTPTGQPSTADAVLQELAIEFELPNLIIQCRSLSKLISTYTDKLIDQIHPKTKRIHTSYNQTGTATGRLSSSNPNLQNIPIRSIEGRRIRQTFIAPPKYLILSADYSQIELRLMAHIAQDPSLLAAFKNDIDVHTSTASEVFEVPLDKVTFDMRRHAKAINFGLIYGMSAFGLIKQLGIERKEAEAYIEKYFARYPQVKNYMENTRKKAREKGYVETLWGRRLYLPEIYSKQIPRQKAAERAAINAPLQGSAADIIKLVMINIHRWLHETKYNARMIMQVHDELVFEVHEDELDTVAASIKEHMINVIKLDVPLQISMGSGKNWDEASKS